MDTQCNCNVIIGSVGPKGQGAMEPGAAEPLLKVPSTATPAAGAQGAVGKLQNSVHLLTAIV